MRTDDKVNKHPYKPSNVSGTSANSSPAVKNRQSIRGEADSSRSPSPFARASSFHGLSCRQRMGGWNIFLMWMTRRRSSIKGQKSWRRWSQMASTTEDGSRERKWRRRRAATSSQSSNPNVQEDVSDGDVCWEQREGCDNWEGRHNWHSGGWIQSKVNA